MRYRGAARECEVMQDFGAAERPAKRSPLVLPLLLLLLLLLQLQQIQCGQTADELPTHLLQQQQRSFQQLRSSSRTRSATVSDLSGVGSGHRTSPMAQQRSSIVGQQLQQQEQLSVAMNDVECPSFAENSACPCYKYEDGIFLECPSITFGALRHTLQIIGSPIQSLSVYDFDRTVKSLTSELFGGTSMVGNPQSGPVMLDPGPIAGTGTTGVPANVTIRHLQFSHSSLKQLRQDSLLPLRAHLKSLRIANGKLDEVPTKSISDLKKLMMLDFESNEIKSINEYAFYGLHLVKINLKGNQIGRVPLNGFAGLEDTLTELDLSENRLRQFPTQALRRLENLRLVRLAANEISALELDDSYTRFGALTFLDLSQNALVELYADFFGAFPALRTLSLYGNDIETVHRDALVSLGELQSLDLSQNRLIQLPPDLFAANRRLHTVDLSRNHLHYVSGLFANLPLLREIFVNENNVLELTDDCFANSTSLKVIYLEHNAIQRLDGRTLATLAGLEQLFLSHNLIRRVPALFFDATPGLLSIALDDNEIDELDGRVFRRLCRLREARLNGNRLQVIEERLFAATEELMELHLQGNRLSVIERGAFQACQQLQYINLQDNALEQIEQIFADDGPTLDGAPLSLVTTRGGLNQAPPMAVTTYGKLISKTESVTDGDLGSHGLLGNLAYGAAGSGQESPLLSIQLNGNALRHLHAQAFLRQTSLQQVWLQDNQLAALDRTLFTELVHLEKLCLRNNSLLVLEPGTLDPLVSLRYLDLSHNRLADLTDDLFRGQAELEELHLAHNLLGALRPHVFGRLAGLRLLDLSHNDLRTLGPATFQPGLPVSSLNLRACNLTSLAAGLFNGLTNLNELLLDENALASTAGELTQTPTIDASALRTLRLSANGGIGRLKEPLLERLPSLQMLFLERCDITELTPGVLRKSVNLVKLELSNNALRTLPRNVFAGLHVFKELRLHGNDFGELPALALLNVSALEVLVLSRNQLTYVDFYRFGGVPNLRTLDLRDNSIGSLSGLQLDTLPHLDTLDLSGNLLLALPEPFFKHSAILQRIDLSQNRLGAIPNAALSGLSLARLTWLNLSGNPLRRIATHDSEHDYPHLKELHISLTNLSIVTSKDFELYPALQTLRLVQNRIARISPGAFFGLGALQTLDLSVNELELLPKERLQGLRQLEHLNISTNSIRELDEFAQDLRRLRLLDASSNQLERLQKNTLRHLVGLQELYLNGNRLVTVSSEAFRTLRALTVLDLRKNYFEFAPLRALKPLETHLQQIRIEDNPLTCSCDTQELWQLLSDHRKWTRGFDGVGVRCEQPVELQGKLLLQLEPQEFCDVPLIQKIAIQDIQPYSVLVSWQNREYSGLHGYHIIYHSLDTIEDIRGKTMNRSSSSAKLTRLSSNTRYLICVLGLGSWLTYENDIHELLNQSNQLQNQILTSGTLHARYANGELDASLSNTLLSLMMDTPTSRCTEVRTLHAIGLQVAGTEESGQPGESLLHSILTRRLGLIVGCCLGIVVFIVLVSVLGWLKIKKRRIEAAKRQQQPHQPEFISYRHFSIPNDEHGRDGVAGAGGGGGIGPASFGTYMTDGHPAFISGAVLGTIDPGGGGGTGARHDERKKIFMTGS